MRCKLDWADWVAAGLTVLGLILLLIGGCDTKDHGFAPRVGAPCDTVRDTIYIRRPDHDPDDAAAQRALRHLDREIARARRNERLRSWI